jgi:hypothetical protein
VPRNARRSLWRSPVSLRALSGRSPGSPTDLRSHPVRSGGGGRRRVTRGPRFGYEHRPPSARSFLDGGPGAAKRRLEVPSPRISA